MNIITQWPEIKGHFKRSFSSNFHVSIASIDEVGNPTVTPIGSLFLNKEQTGFYFEKFPSKLPISNGNVCILAVNSNTWFWLKSLFLGRFYQYPGIKLYGTLGEKRKASKDEIARLNARMKFTKWLKGNDYLWGNMEYVREIHFTRAEKINLGKMTESLGSGSN